MRIIFSSYQELSDILFGTDTEPEEYTSILEMRNQLDYINEIVTRDAERMDFDSVFLGYLQNFVDAVANCDSFYVE